MSHIDLGRHGESIAMEFLRKNGFEILTNNYRYLKGEIDLVGIEGNQIVFIEVKTRSSNYLSPTISVNKKKQLQLVKVANNYIQRYNIHREARFDVVSIVMNERELKIDHIKDAFYPLI